MKRTYVEALEEAVVRAYGDAGLEILTIGGTDQSKTGCFCQPDARGNGFANSGPTPCHSMNWLPCVVEAARTAVNARTRPCPACGSVTKIQSEAMIECTECDWQGDR